MLIERGRMLKEMGRTRWYAGRKTDGILLERYGAPEERGGNRMLVKRDGKLVESGGLLLERGGC
jgi:hypothetical protein